MLLLTIRIYPIVLSLTGSWSDRTVGVVDIRIVQVAVVIDNEHISIAVGIHSIRRERPNRGSLKSKKYKRQNENGLGLNINLFHYDNFKLNWLKILVIF